MKRIIFIALLLAPLFNSTMAQASCGAGQSGGIDVNVTTKEVTYYCFDIEPLSVNDAEIQAKEQIQQDISQTVNANPLTKLLDGSVQFNYSADEGTVYRGIEVNATTGEIIEHIYSDEQIAVFEKNRIKNQAIKQAADLAMTNAETGVNVCVNWATDIENGTECYYQPIIVTQEEIDNQYNSLIELWSPDWFEMLLAWLR